LVQLRFFEYATADSQSIIAQSPRSRSLNCEVYGIAHLTTARPSLALGLEGSANKLGAGIIKHSEDGSTSVLSNIRHTYITPPGEGFQPRDTALHHREWALKVINECLAKAGVSMHDLDCICYTKGIRPLFSAGAD
jgi:hypothetical protein